MTAPPYEHPSPLSRPELFFALIGAIGTDLDDVIASLEMELGAVGYRLQPSIRLSDRLRSLKPYESLSPGADHASLKALMDAGDRVRDSFKDGAAVAALAVTALESERQNGHGGHGTAWVFRSLKHPAEVELLRSVYGQSLTVVSVYDSLDRRRNHLILRNDRAGIDRREAETAVERLIDRDQRGQEPSKLGQNVRAAFPLADFFVDAREEVREQICRLVRLLFGDPRRSPTRDEYGMFSARAASLRSSDLSRQVGAAIVDADGEVLAVGCNEVPRPGGGVYWEGDAEDHRDFTKGKDANAALVNEVLVEVFQELKDARWLSEENASASARELAEKARTRQVFKEARISNLIEFGRVVHAEMTALTYAARNGRAVGGATMFSTTFPCHMCARHIIAAGIVKVTYIEPYPKSLAQELYPEAIALEQDHVEGRVQLQPFIGTAPRRFLEFFDFGRRKDERGFVQEWKPREATPKLRIVGTSHTLVEKELSARILNALKDRDWV